MDQSSSPVSVPGSPAIQELKRGQILQLRAQSDIPQVADLEALNRADGVIARYQHRPAEKKRTRTAPRWTEATRPHPAKAATSHIGIQDLTLIRDATVMGEFGILFGQQEAYLTPFFQTVETDPATGLYRLSSKLRGLIGRSNIAFWANKRPVLRSSVAPTRTIEEPVFFFGKPGGSAYSHFLWDGVSTLWWLEQLDKGVKLLVPSTMPAYQREIIRAAGIGDERLLLRDPLEQLRIRTLYVPGFTAVNNRWIAEGPLEFLTRFARPQAAPVRRIYIDRQGDRSQIRRLLNEEEIWAICARHGFERVTPGRLSFAEKQALFGSTAVLVGQYGGGLQTHFLLPRGAALLCLHSDLFIRDIIDHTAEALGLSVATIVGKADPSAMAGEESLNNSDFRIDPAIFEAALLRMLTPPRSFWQNLRARLRQGLGRGAA